VLDVGTAGVGPWAATLLGYLGANVVKVEGPAGDLLRGDPGRLGVMKGINTIYTVAQLNKRIASLDLKDPINKEAIRRLVEQADVVMDNLRPGTVDRMGLGYPALRSINPDVISASSPAWGDEGPMRDVPGLDMQVQMLSGFASMNGEEGGRPELLRYPQLDFNASCFFVSGILLALIGRQRFGEGQRVTASHLGSNVMLSITRIAEYLASGQAPRPTGSASTAIAPEQYFRCRDGRYLAVSVESDAAWARFCQAVGQPEWLADERFADNRSRVAHRHELGELIQAEFERLSARWWVLLLEEAKVAHSYLYDFDSMLRFHQQVLVNDYLIEAEVPHQGRMYLGGLPWKFERRPLEQLRFPPSAPGQDTELVRRQGFGTDSRFKWNGPAESGRPPLAGLRVVEVCQGIAGPLAGLLLAEAGADVIKVEAPPGDYARSFATVWPGSDDSAIFVQLNRNKRGVTLDLETSAGRAALEELLAEADVLIEERGLDDLRLPDSLIHCRLSGFGEQGPLSEQAASELTLQAWSEYWKNLGRLGDPPLRVGADVASVGTAMMLLIGVLAALFDRFRSGGGERVGVSWLGTMMCMRTAQWAAYSRPDNWGGSYCENAVEPPDHGNQTKDRAIYFTLNRCTEEQFQAILTELGMVDAVKIDPRFATVANITPGGPFYAEAKPIWDRFLSQLTYAQALEAINRHGGMAAEMLSLDEIFEHIQLRTLNLVDSQAQGDYLRTPWRGNWLLPTAAPAPPLGPASQAAPNA
jgi:crotonobetainyl-CoA:carnitine CoA-transferase CaiB-like acyl-CoA transferase